MRRISILVSGILLLTLASCATTNQAGDGESGPSAGELDEPNQPSWYSALTTSISDSTSFTGFAHAVSADRQEARILSEETAVKNLRFEIDRFAEDVRRELTDDGVNGSLGSAAFIRNLRNAVETMPVEGAQTETEFFDEEPVMHAYTRIRISPESVIDGLSARLNNRDFIAALRQHMNI